MANVCFPGSAGLFLRLKKQLPQPSIPLAILLDPLSAGIWQPRSLGEALTVAFIRKASGSLLVSFNSVFIWDKSYLWYESLRKPVAGTFQKD